MNSDLITEIKPSKSDPLLGFWYPACQSSDLGPGKMKGVVLLGLPILVCRMSQGAVASMRDICPHRGMPLSFGHMKDDCVECSYHGWRFDSTGRCRGIPALVEGSPIQADKIGITTYPCRERDGYVWVFLADPTQVIGTRPEVPGLPLPSQPYRLFHVSTKLNCSVDEAVIGLIDPAHGPFVHRSRLWRTPESGHEKAKTYEPIPNGFRMVTHPPSKNSTPYKLLTLFSGGELTTTIDFVLPNRRFELIQCGRLWVSMSQAVTPITDQECRFDFSAAWNVLPWVPFTKPLFRFFAKRFLAQDKLALDRQAIGLRYKSPLMLLGDADTPAKWYYKLKAAHLASVQAGQPLDHPLKGRVTLRWKS
jgi:phenylpropionate dioxygenase-like ring-hydroxylating dioxygenase large terminal subunit